MRVKKGIKIWALCMCMILFVVQLAGCGGSGVEPEEPDEPTTAVLTALEITTPPSRTVYMQGDDFDATGMVVSAVYDDESRVAVTGYTVTPSTQLSPTCTSVAVSYTEGDITVTAYQSITVNAPISVTAISVEQAPEKLTYFEGDTFDPEGLQVSALYSDESKEDVTEDVEILASNPLTADTEYVTLKYNYGGISYTTQISVTVNEVKLSGIEITASPDKTVYGTGDRFSVEGLEVTAHYNDARRDRVLSDSEYEVVNPIIAENVTEVILSYTENGTTKTASVSINVVNKITEIYILQAPTTTVYRDGATFDAAGMIVMAKYADGTENALSGYTVSPTELHTDDEYVTVTYHDVVLDEIYEVRQAVTVEPSLVSLRVAGTLDKSSYKWGESVNLAGLTVYAKYSDESERDVTAAVVVTPRTLAPSDKEVAIEYTDKDITVRTTINVTVSSNDVSVSPTVDTYVCANPDTISDSILKTGNNNKRNIYLSFEVAVAENFDLQRDLEYAVLRLHVESEEKSFRSGVYELAVYAVAFDAVTEEITYAQGNAAKGEQIAAISYKRGSQVAEIDVSAYVKEHCTELNGKFGFMIESTTLPKDSKDMLSFYSSQSTEGKGPELLLACGVDTPVESIEIPSESVTLYQGVTKQLNATVRPFYAADSRLSFESDNEEVATVGADGSVYGVSAGSAVITVKTNNGKTATVNVTVENEPEVYSDEFVAAQDAHVFYETNGTTADTNYGTSNVMRVITSLQTGGVELRRGARSYLVFDFSAYGGTHVDSAIMRLYYTSCNSNFLLGALIDVIEVDTDWSETEITYGNHSLNGPKITSFYVNAASNIAGSSVGSYVDVDLTDYINDNFSRLSGKIGIGLVTTPGNVGAGVYTGANKFETFDSADFQFATRESSAEWQRPRLIIKNGSKTYDSSQEDTTIQPSAAGYFEVSSYVNKKANLGTADLALQIKPQYPRDAWVSFSSLPTSLDATRRVVLRFQTTMAASNVVRSSVSRPVLIKAVNAWGADDTPDKVQTGVLGVVNISNQAGGWYELDVTDYVENLIASGKTEMGVNFSGIVYIKDSQNAFFINAAQLVFVNRDEEPSDELTAAPAVESGTYSLTASENTYIKYTDSNFNGSDAETFDVQSAFASANSPGEQNEGYLKFDIADYTGNKAKSVVVRLYVTGTNADYTSDRWLDVLIASNNWSEDTLTYANAEVTYGIINQVQVKNGTAGAYVEIDITDYFNAYITGRLSEFSLVLKNTANVSNNNSEATNKNTVTFASTRAQIEEQRPTLLLEF